MKIIGVIPARYNSSRFPGKPLALIKGKPMIWWVYNQCCKADRLEAVIVATDDSRIEEACREMCIPVMMTSEDHKTGTERVAEIARKIHADVYINIQGDEPLISPGEVNDLMGIFQNDDSVYFGSLRQKINDVESLVSTSIMKVVVDKNQNALFFSRNPIPSNLKEEAKVDVYRHVGIYGYKRNFLLEFANLPQSPLEIGESMEALRALEYGYDMRVIETQHSSMGVDLPEQIPEIERLIDLGEINRNEM